MKKIIFILICVLSVGLSSVYASNSPQPSNDAPACVNVGNVSATALSNGVLQFKNYNSYKVTVTWTLYGHLSNGTRHPIGGGTTVLGAGEGESKNFRTNDQYISYSVEISTQKCN